MRIRKDDTLGQWVSWGLLVQAAAVPTLLHAQESGQAGQPSSTEVLQEIVVTGVRGSITRALQVKEESVAVVDVITSEDIGKFSDNNLSEALQRIPGVTIDRSELGEGNQINLRANSPTFSAFLAVATRSNQQSISIQSPGSEISAVSISLNRSR